MEEIQKAVRTCLTKYADFNGRAARPEFWWFMLAQLVVVMILNMVWRPLGGLVSLALLLPSLAAGSRRLHDTGKSGWLQLLGLIPIVGWIALIYLTAQPGQAAANQYGSPPEEGHATPVIAPGSQ
jgi:uncharacterized membrane protein YhaH (DUF805 family)